MPEYTVTWTGTYHTHNQEQAAKEAWQAMQRRNSIANVFEVSDEHDMTVRIDLDDITDGPAAWVPGNRTMAELAEWMAAEQWPVDEIIEMVRSPHKYANEYSKMIMDKAFDVVAQEPEEIDDGAEDGTDETTKES